MPPADDETAALRVILLTHVGLLKARLTTIDANIRTFVLAARLAGATWAQIADALEITPQAARQRFGHDAPPAS